MRRAFAAEAGALIQEEDGLELHRNFEMTSASQMQRPGLRVTTESQDDYDGEDMASRIAAVTRRGPHWKHTVKCAGACIWTTCEERRQDWRTVWRVTPEDLAIAIDPPQWAPMMPMPRRTGTWKCYFVRPAAPQNR